MPADYRQRVKAQFDVLDQEARTQRNKLDAVVAGIKPMLNCVDLEVAPQPDGRPPHRHARTPSSRGARGVGEL